MADGNIAPAIKIRTRRAVATTLHGAAHALETATDETIDAVAATVQASLIEALFRISSRKEDAK